MDDAHVSNSDRARHSCESCRRKKTKCPAERPICSICERLNQRCIYLPRNRPSPGYERSKVSRPRQDKDRFQMLESQVSNLYEIIQQFSDRDAINASNSSTSRSGSLLATMTMPRIAQESTRFSSVNHGPSSSALDECIHTYHMKIHAQPLQLFEASSLKQHLIASPQYLLRAFLALTLNLCTPEFYDGRVAEAVTYYSDSAHQMIDALAGQGRASTNMVQASCLLTISEVIGSKIATAWMSIGTAARVETLRRLSRSNDDNYQDDSDVRCRWSMFMLERMFCSRSPYSVRSEDLLQLPASPSLPLSPVQSSSFSAPPQVYSTHSPEDDESAGFATPDHGIQDFGINVSCVKAVAVWSDVVSYLHDVRSGKMELPWTLNSTYNQLHAKVCDCDAHFSNNHLLRNVSLQKRTVEDLTQYREYWSVWSLTQVAIHGSQAIMNHPFLHLIIPQERSPILQSRVFQQQTVDQALFHSGWVARLIRACEDVQLEINDLLIGNIVAAVATIPWLFQFARDQKVAQRARTDVKTCDRLLSRMSVMWPPLADKVTTLRELQALAEDGRHDTPRGNTTATFKPLSVWKLLESDISQTIQVNSGDEQPGARDDSSRDTMIRVATKFVHPLVEESSNRTNPTVDMQGDASQIAPGHDTFEPSMLDLYLQLDPDDFQWMDLQN